MIKACLSNDCSNSKDKILTISDDKQALSTYRIDENGRRVLCNTRTSCRIRQDFPFIAQKSFDVAEIMADPKFQETVNILDKLDGRTQAALLGAILKANFRLNKPVPK